MQDRSTVERGLLDDGLVPEEITQVKMGKIVKEKYPELEQEDQEAIRQHAVAAINLTQKAKEISIGENSSGLNNSDQKSNTALVDGIRKFVTDVSNLNVDLIDRINPFGGAYSILSKTMTEESLRQLHSIISSKKLSMNLEEARDLTKRAIKFKQERNRLPSINSSDPWEKEGLLKVLLSCSVKRRKNLMTDITDKELLDTLGIEVEKKKSSPFLHRGTNSFRF